MPRQLDRTEIRPRDACALKRVLGGLDRTDAEQMRLDAETARDAMRASGLAPIALSPPSSASSSAEEPSFRGRNSRR